MQHYKVHAELEAALKPTIRLPSGGSIVIEPTEALTVIDVNSGKLTQSKSLQDTVLRTNLEAATEIARQLRLRDIGGVIIIDFISMDHASDRKKVIAHLEEALKPDKSRPQITSQFSEHGLLEVARRRQGQSLTEQLTKPCPSCHGYGRVRNEVYSAAPVPATLEVAPPDEPEAIVEDLIEEPIAGPDMRDSEPEPGALVASAPQRGRGRGHSATRVSGTPVVPAALPGIEPDLYDDVEDLGSKEGAVGSEDEGREGGRRRRRRRRRGRGRGGERAAEAAPIMTVVGAPGDETAAAGAEYDHEPEEIELLEPASGSGGPEGAGEEEERRGRRRRRRRRGGRGRRGEGAEGVPPTPPLEPAVALTPQAGAARGFARPPGREQREARREVAELVPVGEPQHREPVAGDEPEPRDRGRFGRERGGRGERDFGFRDRGAREYGEPESPPASAAPVERAAGPAPVATQVAGAPAPEAAPAAAAAAPAARKLPRGITPHRPIVGPLQKTAPYQPKLAATRPRMELREVAPGVMQLVPVEEARPASEAQAPATQAGSATAVLPRATSEPPVARAGTGLPPSEAASGALAAETGSVTETPAAAPWPEAGAEGQVTAPPRKPAARSAATRKKAEPEVAADSTPETQAAEAPEADTEAADGKKTATRKRTTASATNTAAPAPSATKSRSTTSRARKPAATE